MKGLAMRRLLLASGLGAALVAGVAAVAFSGGIPTTTHEFVVFRKDRAVGKMRLKVMEVGDSRILTWRFEARHDEKTAVFASNAVYRAGERPTPVRVQGETHLGAFKLMKGTLEFAEDGRSARAEVEGYASKDLKPWDPPKADERDVEVPEGLVLSYPAFVWFAPRLLGKAGRIEDVVRMDCPDDLDFPEFVNFTAGLVLVRTDAEDGAQTYAMRRFYSGGNFRDVATLRLAPDGRIVESTVPPFTVRPAGEAEAKDDEK
jgi:hypothetical protein